MKERKEQTEKIKELTEQLHNGIKELFESDRYKDYLQAMSKFHNYSFNNSLLIWAQRPDASYVCGYRGWQTKFGRTVLPGSKGIMIMEPVPWKKTVQEIVTDAQGDPILDQNGKELTKEVERTFQSFKVGYVFAYEDTVGKPLPSIVSIVDGEVENFNLMIASLQAISPAPIRFENFQNSANGYYDLEKREIVVKSSLPQAQQLKTAVHECSHAILHDKINGLDQEASRREMEVSAESVAFVVCNYLGLDTSEYSFGYVGGWSAGKELKELQQKMEVIRKTADTIITGMETEIMKQRAGTPEIAKEMNVNATVVIVQNEKREKTISHRR